MAPPPSCSACSWRKPSCKCGHSFPVQASCQGPLTCVTVNKLQEHMHAFQNGETLRVNPIESRIWHDLCAAYMRIWHL